MPRFGILTVVCLGFLCSTSFAATPATNAWISSASGYWEEPNWSLGVMPGDSQTVLLTNSGTKDLIIGASTTQNYPESLNIFFVVIASSPNSTNRLFLDHAGLAVPLSVHGLTMYSNSFLTLAGSALLVPPMGNGCSIGGTFNQGDFSTVSAPTIHLGDLGPAAYNLTNGSVNVRNEHIGESFPSTFFQQGGSHAVTNMYMYNNSQYVLGGGQFSAGTVQVNDTSRLVLNGGNFSGLVYLFSSFPLIVGAGQFSGGVNVYTGAQLILNSNQLSGPVTVAGGTFTQSGGLFNGGLTLNSGSYFLQAGVSSNTSMYVSYGLSSTSASVLQSGGTNQCGALSVQSSQQSPSGGYFTLSNGVLVTSSTAVGVNASFNQWGGSHTVSGTVSLLGGIGPFNQLLRANYSLAAGLLSANSVSLDLAILSQSGGTNSITGTLNIGSASPSSFYFLDGGRLEAATTVLSGANTFIQNGGVFVAGDILVQGALYHNGGFLSQTGTLTLANGFWQCNTGRVDLGQFKLGGTGGTNGTLALPNGSAMIAFANSSGITWSNQGTLKIENWNGSIHGGGAHKILFGNTAAGLTAQQLSQIRFHNPAGLSGTWPARILATGEITPGPVLETAPSGKALVLMWSANSILQTATNVTGPYQDLTNVFSPYTNQSTDPQRYFRLRQ